MHKNSNTRVLVMVSSYNGEAFVAQQIDSILNQTYQNIDIVVRDDGSSDGTPAILAKYEKENGNITVLTGENQGCTRSFWELLQYARQKKDFYAYFAFCDQDDVWLEDKIAVATDCLTKTDPSQPHMYCSNLILTDARLNRTGTMRTGIPEVGNKAKALVESFATGCTFVFNRQVLELATSYTAQVPPLHDLWIFHTCMFLGHIHYDPTPHILYRQHGNNEIGAKSTFSQRLRSKMKSVKTLRHQHFREMEARELLKAYGRLLSKEDYALINAVATYRNRPLCRLGWFFNLLPVARNIKMTRFTDNFFLKLRILIGKV